MNLQEKYNKSTLTLDETAAELGVDTSDVAQIIKHGELNTKTIGSKIIIPVMDLERYLSSSTDISPICSNMVNSKQITVKEYLNRNLLSFYPKASDRTKQCYVTAAKTIVKLIGDLKLADLNREILQNALYSISYKSQSAIDKIRLVMKKMIDIAIDDDLIHKNIAAKVISPKSDKVDIRTDEEKIYIQKQIAEILTFAKEEKDPQLFTILTILSFTGIRPGELRGLGKKDVHIKTKELTIRQAATTKAGISENESVTGTAKPREYIIGPTKSRSGIRTLYLGNELMVVILHWILYLKKHNPVQYKSKLLFPNSKGGILRDDVLLQKFRRFKKRHGISSQYNLYRFRHTFCTNLFHEKVDIKTVQRLMGDATVDVILNVYTHVMDEDAKRAGEEINQAYVKMLPDLFEPNHKIYTHIE